MKPPLLYSSEEQPGATHLTGRTRPEEMDGEVKTMNTLIKQARLLNPAGHEDKPADVLISDGVIKDIGLSLKAPEAETIDAEGQWLLPGLVDIHVHLREPGFEGKETIATGTRAAAAGGITSLVCLGDTNPPIDDKTGIEYIVERVIKTGSGVRVYPVGVLSKNMEGEEIAPIGEMVEAGAVAISDDKPIMNAQVMRRAMEYSTIFNIPLIAHCEDIHLTENGLVHDGLMAIELGMLSCPAEAEAVIVARDLLLAKKTGCHIHISHVSTADSVDLIRFYKNKGVHATADTAPHYLLLTENVLEGFDTNAKTNPPLRSQSDQEALIEGLKDGTIDCIASHHEPHSHADKNQEFQLAPTGVVGLETLLPLVLNQISEKTSLDLLPLIRLVTHNPANVMKLNGGRVEIGKPADLTLWNPSSKTTIRKESFLSKSRNTLFEGWPVNGHVERTFVAGRCIYRAQQ